MLNVLIVDDEMKVCWLLEQIIEWEQLRAKCIGMVQNGVEAYAFTEKNRPDVIITDIRMPDMDGLELVRKVKEIHPDCIFIIISGYQQFEYAHAAIKYGVADFLLKPINKEEINAVLKRISDQKIKKNYIFSEFLQQQKNSKIREREAQAIIEELLNADHLSEKVMEYLPAAYIQGAWMCLGVRVDQMNLKKSADEEDFFHIRAFNAVKPDIPEKIIWKGLYFAGLLLLILNGEDKEILLQQNFEEYRNDIRTYLQGFGECKVTVVYSSVCGKIDGVPVCAKEVRELLDARIGGLAGTVFGPEEVATEKNPQLFIRESERKRFQNCLELLDWEACQEVMESCAKRVKRGSMRQEYRSVLDTFLWICRQYCSVMTQMSFISKENVKEDSAVLDLCLRNAGSISWLEQNVSQFMGEKLAEYKKLKTEMDSRPVLLARQYVEDNTDRDCSLQEVAEYVGLSPNYFSTIFSEEAGMTFKDYVTDIKISRAKQLLLSTNDKINVISEKLGYKDSKYFSRLFEKKVSLKPAQYRKIMR